MRIDIARQPLIIILLQFFLLLVLFWCRYSLFPVSFELAGVADAPHTESIINLLPGDWLNGYAAKAPLYGEIASMLLIIIMQYIIIKIMSRNLFFPSRTYLPSVLFILVGCGIYFPGGDLSAVFAAYILLCACSAFIASFVRAASFGKSFKGALLLGSAVLFQPSFAVFLLLAPAAMRLFRRSGRETLVAIAGMMVPLVAYAYIVWAAGGEFSWVFIRLWNDIMEPGMFYITSSATDRLRIVVAGILTLLIVMSVITFYMASGMMRTRPYKINLFMQVFLILSLSSIFLPNRAVGNLLAMAIPVSFIAPAFFVRFHGAIPALVYLALIASAVALNVIPFVLR